MPHAQTHPSDHAENFQADFRVDYHGILTTITPLTDRCLEWVEENVDIEPWQRFGTSIAVEPRYLETLVEALLAEGFTAEGE